MLLGGATGSAEKKGKAMKKRIMGLLTAAFLLWSMLPVPAQAASNSIESCTVSLAGNMTYNGNAITPMVTVLDGSTMLKRYIHYNLTFQDNVNAGTASVIVTGVGDYEGTKKTVSFTIARASQTVTLTAECDSLAIGETVQLHASATGAISYASSNADIASVDAAGVVTAKAIGTVTITATGAQTNNYNAGSASVTLAVTKKRTPVLAFAQTAYQCTDETAAFVHPLSYTGDGTVSYTSSDPSVAAVDAATGCVTPLWPGTTTITAAASEGATYEAATATYTLTVAGASGAQYGVCGENLKWKLAADGTLYVHGSGEMAESPPWLTYADAIKRVQLDDTITTIAAGAFEKCTNLAEVSTLSDQITSIGMGAFRGCTALAALSVSADNLIYTAADGCVYTKDMQTLVLCPAGKSGAFVVPDGVTCIADEAFYGCDTLTQLTFPSGLTQIGARACMGCTSLSSVTIPDGVTTLGEQAFYCQYGGLQTAVIPASVTAIGTNAFASNVVLYGVSGSMAEQYAKENKLDFYTENNNLSTYDIKLETARYTYDGQAKQPEVVVCTPDLAKTLTEGTDYTLQYRDNIHAGDATVVITGCGSYTGAAAERTFVIDKASPVLSFSAAQVSKTYGETFAQCVSAQTDGTITYRSSNTGVARVDASTGAVTLCSSGTAVITAQAAEGHDYLSGTAAYTLTVNRAAQRMQASLDAAQLEVGQSAAMHVSDAHGEVRIVSSDSTIASVSGSTVCAKAAGAVTITVTAAGDSCYNAASASLRLTVIPIQATGVSLSESELYLHPGETYTLSAAVSPSNAADRSVTWRSGDASVVTVQDGKLNAVHTGSARITAQTANGKTAACTVSVCPTAQTLFSDVFPNQWFYRYVQGVSDRALMNGIGGGKFDPGGTMTRAMAVQILYNREGRPAASGIAFSDVPRSAWYYDAVQWASANGVVSGVGNNRFDPNANVTREQFAKILYNYSGAPAVSGSLSFPDADKVSGWAYDAILWANQNEIIRGKATASGNILDPRGQATRAEAATMLMQYIVII